MCSSQALTRPGKVSLDPEEDPTTDPAAVLLFQDRRHPTPTGSGFRCLNKRVWIPDETLRVYLAPRTQGPGQNPSIPHSLHHTHSDPGVSKISSGDNLLTPAAHIQPERPIKVRSFLQITFTFCLLKFFSTKSDLQ
jgi:hypothetical protein